MEFTEIDLQTDDGLARLTLNRPEKVNALSRRMIAELAVALDRIADDHQVRVVILGAAGKHFCAGHLLDEMVDRNPAEYRQIFEDCTAMMSRLARLSQPIIAQVQGVATAAGCQLAAACDMVVAASSARFATPGVKIGLFCSTPAVALVRCIGRKRALEMLLTGRWVGAEEAADWGLVNRVAPKDELAAEAEKLARQIAAASPLTLAVGKRTFYDQVDRPQDEAYHLATPVMALNLAMDDAQEGIKAFMEKRAAIWSGVPPRPKGPGR